MAKTFALHYGTSKKVLATVIPDDKWPTMWRIHWPDGQLSDMVNIARAKDAAFSIAARKLSIKDHDCFRWTVAREDGKPAA
jgi:hypothetical protein